MGRYEIHQFTVQNEVLWKKYIKFPRASNITLFSYNPTLSLFFTIDYRGLEPGYERSAYREILRVYPFNSTTSTIGASL